MAFLVAWGLGLAIALLGMLDLIGNFDYTLATAYFVLLLTAPVVWIASRPAEPPQRMEAAPWLSRISPWRLAAAVGLVSLGTSAFVGQQFDGLPPAYHDEYSYLFQARTFLAGELAFPSHPTHPDLFDQMHVLNEGRFASRYFPGTGAWLAPFVAIGHPYWGYWLAGAIAAVLTFGTGRELAGNFVGLVAGLVVALSPGMAVFANLLLAHHPTLVGLSLFLFGMTRFQRTIHWRDALLAGTGLAYAMLCRPATAAGVGLPFGLWFGWWLLRGGRGESPRAPGSRIRAALAMTAPLVAGFAVMLVYNQAVTGDALISPYQRYTDLYTPRHVYGFNNVVRGEQRLGPDVIESYDRWAENLTPSLAATNTLVRHLASWQWTLDLIPLAMATVVFLAQPFGERRWWLIFAAIVSLHAVHVPYWYTGIMGWHYVFESGPLWGLVLARGMQLAGAAWQTAGRHGMTAWCAALLGLAVLGTWVPVPGGWDDRAGLAIGTVRYPRQVYAAFHAAIDEAVAVRPALVLLAPRYPDRHLDFITNDPALENEILFGRIDPEIADLAEIVADFENRAVYWGEIANGRLVRLVRVDVQN